VDILDSSEPDAHDLGEPEHVVDRVRCVLLNQPGEDVAAEDGIRTADHIDDPEGILAPLDRRLVRPVHERAHCDERIPALRVWPDGLDPSRGDGYAGVGIHSADDPLDVVGGDRRVVVEDGDVVVVLGETEIRSSLSQRLRLTAADRAVEYLRAGAGCHRGCEIGRPIGDNEHIGLIDRRADNVSDRRCPVLARDQHRDAVTNPAQRHESMVVGGAASRLTCLGQKGRTSV
jgi:hypothetical protein